MSSIYDDLIPELDQIRLLQLQPAALPSTCIRCRLMTHSLSDTLSYEAISYVWGNPDDTVPIEVNGEGFDATRNLVAGLKHIRHPASPVLLWVDAICINQSKVSERNHQVQLMKRIYMEAEKTIIWLGEEENDSNLALDLIRRWSPPLPPNVHSTEISSVTELLKIIPDPFELRAWEALRKFFARPYWERSWILQEVVFAKQVHLLCGSEAISWQALSVAQLAWVQLHYPGSHNPIGSEELRMVRLSNYNVATTISDRRVGRMINAAEPTAVKLIRFTAKSKATDPRDKIYSLLGFDEIRLLDLKPDYDKAVEILYAEVVKAILQGERRLDILSQAGIGWSSLQPALDLPSWVPDFRGTSDRGAHLGDFHASGSEKPIATISDNFRVLTAQGVIYDAIHDIEYYDEDSNVVMTSWLKLALSQADYHPTGIPQLQAYFRTVIADGSGYGYGLPQFKDNASKKRFFDAMAGMMWRLGRWVIDNDQIPPGFYNRIKPEELARVLRMDDYIRLFQLWSGYIPENINRQDLLAPFLEGRERKNRILLDEEENIEKGLKCLAMYLRRIESACINRTFFISKKGYMGLAPKASKAGDLICVLLGCDKPLIIRMVDDYYVLVGDSYIYGIMEGEALEDVWTITEGVGDIAFR
jgi:hypothetical protein